MAATVATAVGLASVGSMVAQLAMGGASSTAILGVDGWGLQLRVDALSTTMLAVVAFVGVVVVRFSRRYLGGDPRRSVFFRDLCLTLAGVSTFVLSGNLAQLVLGWLVTGFGLHNLLSFYRDRPRSALAVRKKFVVARVGDACLLAAVVSLSIAFSTGDMASISAAARAMDPGEVGGFVVSAAALLAIAACLKSAQLPTHGWLLDVMETPTPVSALLHAGLVNAGGFLLIRFADVMLLSKAALVSVAIVGATTAVFGAAAMNAQTRIKASLAYSTVGQMGFMLLQCGLGAFSAAIVHLVAHSLYKAHAFLRSGSTVAAPARRQDRATDRGLGWLAASTVIAVTVFVTFGWLFGLSVEHEPGVFVLGGALVIGLAYVFSTAATRWLTAAASLGLLSLLSAAYFAIQSLAMVVYASVVPTAPALSVPSIVVGVTTLAAFVILSLLQWALPARSPALARLYVAIKNGLYVGAWFDRAAQASLANHRSR